MGLLWLKVLRKNNSEQAWTNPKGGGAYISNFALSKIAGPPLYALGGVWFLHLR